MTDRLTKKSKKSSFKKGKYTKMSGGVRKRKTKRKRKTRNKRHRKQKLNSIRKMKNLKGGSLNGSLNSNLSFDFAQEIDLTDATYKIKDGVFFAKFNRSGTHLVIVTVGKKVVIYEYQNRKFILYTTNDKIHDNLIYADIKIGGDGENLLAIVGNKTVQIYKVNETIEDTPSYILNVYHDLPVSGELLRCVNFNNDGTRIIVVYNNYTLLYCKTYAGEYQYFDRVKHTKRVNYANFSPDGGRVITASDDQIMIHIAYFSKFGGGLEIHLQPGPPIKCANISRDKKKLVIAVGNYITIYNLSDRTVKNCKQMDNNVNYADFSHDSSSIVYASEGGYAEILNVDEVNPWKFLSVNVGSLSYANFSSDDNIVVCHTDAFHQAIIYNVRS